jgi:type IV secretion system protein VirB10
MAVLGLGLLSWYYAQAYSHRHKAQDEARASTQSKAQGDMPLPALGRVDPPTFVRTTADNGVADRILGGRPALPRMERFGPPPMSKPRRRIRWEPPPSAPPTGGWRGRFSRRLTARATLQRYQPPYSLAAVRRMPGPTVSRMGVPGRVRPRQCGHAPASDRYAGRPCASTADPAAAAPERSLHRLHPRNRHRQFAAWAHDLRNGHGHLRGRRPGGPPGARYQARRRDPRRGPAGNRTGIRSMDGGRTPTGVVVPLASPGTDELGRSGLPGVVDRHFMDRFGAAILISMIDGAIQAASSRRKRRWHRHLQPEQRH